LSRGGRGPGITGVSVHKIMNSTSIRATLYSGYVLLVKTLLGYERCDTRAKQPV